MEPENNPYLEKEQLDQINKEKALNEFIVIDSSVEKKPEQNYQKTANKNNAYINEMSLEKNQINERAEILEDWLVNSIAPIENMNESKKHEVETLDEKEELIEDVNIDKLIELSKIRNLLKKRREERKVKLQKDILSKLDKMNINVEILCDCDLIDQLQRNTWKIQKIVKNI